MLSLSAVVDAAVTTVTATVHPAPAADDPGAGLMNDQEQTTLVAVSGFLC